MVPELLGMTSPSTISLFSGSLSRPAFWANAIIWATVTANWLSFVLPRTVISEKSVVGAPWSSYWTGVSTPNEGVFHTNRSEILFRVWLVNTYSFKKVFVKLMFSEGSWAVNSNFPWSSMHDTMSATAIKVKVNTRVIFFMVVCFKVKLISRVLDQIWIDNNDVIWKWK